MMTKYHCLDDHHTVKPFSVFTLVTLRVVLTTEKIWYVHFLVTYTLLSATKKRAQWIVIQTLEKGHARKTQVIGHSTGN